MPGHGAPFGPVVKPPENPVQNGAVGLARAAAFVGLVPGEMRTDEIKLFVRKVGTIQETSLQSFGWLFTPLTSVNKV